MKQVKNKAKQKLTTAKDSLRRFVQTRNPAPCDPEPAQVGQPSGASNATATTPLNALGSDVRFLQATEIDSTTIQTASPRAEALHGSGATGSEPGSQNNHARPGLKLLQNFLNEASELFGPLRSVFGEIQQLVRAFEEETQVGKDRRALIADLDAVFVQLRELLTTGKTPEVKRSIEKAAGDIKTEIELVTGNLQHRETSLLTKATDDADVERFYRRMRTILDMLMVSLNASAASAAHEQAMNQRLKNLPDSPAARYDSAQAVSLRRGACTHDTRVDVLRQIEMWSEDPNGHRVYWLNGMAGTGKTTIAYSVCKQLASTDRLAASFFCSRQLPECREVNRIVPTIAYQLSLRSPAFRNALCRVLESTPEACDRPLEEQFDRLIVAPLGEVGASFPARLMVVVDAVDECDNQGIVDRLLQMILVQGLALPVRFFITSRPEAKIRDRVENKQHDGVRTELRLHELEGMTVQQDIRTYLTTELKPANLSDDQIGTLVERSGVLFIYAATVVRYLSHDNFTKCSLRLRRLLDGAASSRGSPGRDIDTLYASILEAALHGCEDEESERTMMMDVLGTVICAREPLSLEAIGHLLKYQEGTAIVVAILRPLCSVLHVANSTGMVTTLHESFPDYLLDPKRSGDFHCQWALRNACMAYQCFDVIGAVDPPFNICKLESSYRLDDEVQDLNEKLKTYISNALSYSCCYWYEHMAQAAPAEEMVNRVEWLMEERLLLWLEVVNLKRYRSEIEATLKNAVSWSKNSRCPMSTRELIQDAVHFWRVFYMGVGCQSTPHIYISGLTHWPACRAISQTYKHQIASGVLVSGPAVDKQSWALVGEIRTGSRVRSVASSPDGAQIVSDCDDYGLRIWDTHTGQQVGQSLHCHTGSIRSVAYSPDGTSVVSGSEDCTVRIWNASTGMQVGQPLQGHTSIVWSVAYSPDGTRIVSGSWDHTLRIWDAHTGMQVGQPLRGHTEAVNSVAYAPDGAHLVSGSWDRTLRIWNAHTGMQVGQPLHGHTECINSVAYSPDGIHIVSGSQDLTLRIWDARAGMQIGQSLQGHTSTVSSVAYSPDGIHIVSGSWDHTLRIWDSHAGKQVGQLQGHASRVGRAAYSPDGAHIVSCSDDCTLRIWDAHAGKHMEQSPQGHTDSINSVAYSPDGVHIVSGSDDCTLRIWDAHTGQQVGQPLQSHASAVYSVAYTPNGTHIVSCSENRILYIWDARTRKQVRQLLPGHTSSTWPLAHSSDGTHVVFYSTDHTLKIWDAHTGKQAGQTLQGHTSIVCSVAYSPDGAHLVSGSADFTLRIWDVHTGREVGQPLQGHTEGVTCVAYSPDGTRIVSGSSDHTLRIWDARTGTQLGKPFQGHTWPVSSVAYSPDGTHVVSGSDDYTLRIWDAYTGNQVGQPLQGHTHRVCSVAYSPDGAHIVSGSADGALRIWEVHTGQRVEEPPRGHIGSIPPPDRAHMVSSLGNDILPTQHAAGGSKLDIPQQSGQYAPGQSLGSITQPHQFMTWVLDGDGWITVGADMRLIWIPPELRKSLLHPRNTLLISPHGWLHLDFSCAYLGTQWTKCYRPTLRGREPSPRF